MTGFSGFCGFGLNLLLELLAIKHGLDVAWDRGHRRIILQSDSQEAIRLVKEGNYKFHKLDVIIVDVKFFIALNGR
jgi:ribonuclease HI